MNEIKQYHLYKDDDTRLHFDVFAAGPYCRANHPHAFKAHRHSFYQLIWFAEAGVHYVDYETVEHPANALFFINSRQVHYFCDHAPNEGFLYHFDELFLTRYSGPDQDWLRYRLFNELGTPFVVLDEIRQTEFGAVTEMLQRELSERQHNYRPRAFHLFQTLLLTLERLRQTRGEEGDRPDAGFLQALRFRQLIEEHLDQHLTIGDYAAHLGVSSKKLTLLSKTHLGGTPATIISKRKILEAKRLLSNLKLSVKEIAFALGFDQPTYFTKYFKKHTRITPKEFIRRLP